MNHAAIVSCQQAKAINGRMKHGTMVVGPLNYKGAKVNSLGDPRLHGSNLVWSISMDVLGFGSQSHNDAGNPIDPASLGADDAARLLAERDIQDIKILFYKLKKSFTTVCGKTLLPKLADFYEDVTKLLIFIVQNTQSTTSAAMCNAQSDLKKLSFKEA